MQSDVRTEVTGVSRPATRLFGEVYAELRALAGAYARREPFRTAPTSILHEAIIRTGNLDAFASETEMIAAVACSLRRSLVDRARRRRAAKRGGGHTRVNTPVEELVEADCSFEVLEIDELLDRLALTDPRAARVTELRFFGGLDLDRISGLLAVSRKTVVQDWAFARAWLSSRLANEPEADHA